MLIKPLAPAAEPETLRQRKADHLDLCATGPVGFQQRTTLLEQVELLHNAIPEVSYDDLDLRCVLLGKTLRAPLLIASMSGGTQEAVAFNFDLAEVAEQLGIGLALGSQRGLLVPGRITDGYFLRSKAPSTLLLGNIGGVQAAQLSTQELEDKLIGPCGLDGLCIHLNPAQELIQPEGDRDFRGVEAAIIRLAQELSIPVVVKETGCGLSRAVGVRLVQAGVKVVDVSGAGGTSWVGVETLRATGRQAKLGQLLWDWGLPTAACLVQLSGLPLACIATGGMSSGLDMAKALALGAQAVGVARPFLQAWRQEGKPGLLEAVETLLAGLRMVMVLTGSPDVASLRQQPVLLGEQLRRYVPAGSPLLQRGQF